MGARETVLARLLGAAPRTRHRLYVDTLPPQAQDQLHRLYQALGGVHDALPTYYTGGWDMELPDGLTVELDEEQHFTCYREVSLQQKWGRELPWRQQYLGLLVRYEAEGMRAAASRPGYWTNPKSVRMFGPSSPRGVWEPLGSSRSKQRALYDATKDLMALYGMVRLARLSIWDQVGGVLVGDVLKGRAQVDTKALMKLVEERTAG